MSLKNTKYIAFLQDDAAGMAQQVAWSAGKPGVEDELLDSRGPDRRRFSGRLGKGSGIFPPCGGLRRRADEKEAAATYEAEAGCAGSPARQRRRGTTACRCGDGALDTAAMCRLARRSRWPWQGTTARAQALTDGLGNASRRHARPVQLPPDAPRKARGQKGKCFRGP